jgi:streptomycin 6-kinase
MRTDVELPDMVRRRALAYGAVGEQWLCDLPAVVEELATRWELRMGATLSGGTAAYVAEATTATGAAAVLKVAMPAAIDGDGAFARTVEVYELTRGRGCARLLGHDRARSALLLERLGVDLALAYAAPVRSGSRGARARRRPRLEHAAEPRWVQARRSRRFGVGACA